MDAASSAKRGGTNQRRRVREPEAVHAFAGRLRHALFAARETQVTMARTLGGLSAPTMNRLMTGSAQSIAIDTLARLALWAHRHNFSVLWLFSGQGPIHTGKETSS